MDHKVSKDMISSGMTPSGEKTQADLGRTQYGSAPSPSRLMDAYHSMYQTQKEETLEEHHQKDKNGNTIPHEDDVKEGKIPAGLQAYLDKKKGKKKDDDGDEKKDVKDSYDLVYNHFINEGFSEEETYERMSNLTEQQLDEFLSAVAKFGTGLFKGGKTLAKTTFNKTKNLADKAMNKVKNITKPSGNSPKITSSGGKIEQGGNDKPRNNILSTDNLVKAQVVGSMLSGSGGQQKQRSGTVSASADLFDIVKGKLIDEGLNEKEIKDIMLTLTPDEILNEISVGKMADYISAADKDVQKTATDIQKGKSVMGDDPRVKKMTQRAKGMAMAGTKIAKKLTPPSMP